MSLLPVQSMAAILAASPLDLDHEPRCIQELVAACFPIEDIVRGLTEAVVLAKILRAEAARQPQESAACAC